MKYKKYYLIVLVVILIDQISKLLVYQHMDMGYAGEINILGFDWARLHYTLNPGMAFGLRIIPKLALTLFRIAAITVLTYFFILQIKNKAHVGFLFCLAMILGGAVGNAIDSVFYGVFLEGNMLEGSPTPWLHGQVIDMLYFPMFEGRFPEWLPRIGGNRFLFFSAIFNVADSAIFIGAVSLLVFSRRFFPETEEKTVEGGRQTDASIDGEETNKDEQAMTEGEEAAEREEAIIEEQNTRNIKFTENGEQSTKNEEHI